MVSTAPVRTRGRLHWPPTHELSDPVGVHLDSERPPESTALPGQCNTILARAHPSPPTRTYSDNQAVRTDSNPHERTRIEYLPAPDTRTLGQGLLFFPSVISAFIIAEDFHPSSLITIDGCNCFDGALCTVCFGV